MASRRSFSVVSICVSLMRLLISTTTNMTIRSTFIAPGGQSVQIGERKSRH